MVGWLIFLAFLGGATSIVLAAMQQCVSMNMMMSYGFDTQNGSPAPSQNGQFGIAVFVAVFGAVFCALPMRYLNKLAISSFWWLIFAATLIIVVIPILSRGNPSSSAAQVCSPTYVPGGSCWSSHPAGQNTNYVFRSNTLTDNSKVNGMATAGLGSQAKQNGYTFCNGLLMAQYLILVFDVPGHMAEETKAASYTVPRAILSSYFLGSAINFGLLLTFLYSITVKNNAAIPGFGITSSCQTINGSPTIDNATAISLGYMMNGAGDASVYGFGDLPPWSTNSLGPGVPNDGIQLNTVGKGGCILSNGLPFSYGTVPNIFYDAFAAKFPRCTPDQAYGPATWQLNMDGNLYDTGVVTPGVTVYNSYLCLPINQGGCCDITGAIGPTAAGRNGAIFFVFLIFIGVMFTDVMNYLAASRFIYSFARDGGFPASISAVISRVEPRTGAPMYAILVFMVFQILFCVAWTNSNPQVAFNAVSGLNSNAFLTVYGMPLLLRFTTALRTFKPAKEFDLKWASIPMAIIGAAYGAFSVGTIAMPNFYPITKNTVNYAPVALAAVIVFATVLFPVAVFPQFANFWNYKGPSFHSHRDDNLYPGEESMREAQFPGLKEKAALAEAASI